MSLSGQQHKQLQDALLNAFPTVADLEQMLAFGLDKNLRAIAGEGSLQEIVFKLIQTANAQGWVKELVSAARKSNPGNELLKATAGTLLSDIDPKPSNLLQKILIFSVVSVVIILGAVIAKPLLYPLNETQAKYAQLKDSLKAKDWGDADNQTFQLMLNIAKREGNLDIDHINSFSCPDLQRIDKLWVSNSDNRFGFSVQKEIWIKTGNQLGIKAEQWNDNLDKNYLQFAFEVGWYDYKVKEKETGNSRGEFVSYDELRKRIRMNPTYNRGSLPVVGANVAQKSVVQSFIHLFSHCDL